MFTIRNAAGQCHGNKALSGSISETSETDSYFLGRKTLVKTLVLMMVLALAPPTSVGCYSERGGDAQPEGPDPSTASTATPPSAGILHVNTSSPWPLSSDPPGRGIFDLLVTEATHRVGLEVVFDAVPAERSIRNVSAGLADGDGPRIREMDSLYPNLVRVPEALLNFEFVAFSRDAGISTDSWSDLWPYHVAAPRGWKILEINLEASLSLTTTRTVADSFAVLDAGRVDVVVGERRIGESLLQSMGLEDVFVLEPPVDSREVFLFLNARHQHLIEPIAAALHQMKADGTYDELVESVLSQRSGE